MWLGNSVILLGFWQFCFVQTRTVLNLVPPHLIHNCVSRTSYFISPPPPPPTPPESTGLWHVYVIKIFVFVVHPI